MSDRSYVEVTFGPVSGRATAQMGVFISGGPASGFAVKLRAIKDACIDGDFDIHCIHKNDGDAYYSFEVVEMNSGTSNDKVAAFPKRLRKLGIGYDAHDGGCSGVWNPDLTWWRLGMAKPAHALEADMGGAVATMAALESTLDGYPEAPAAMWATLGVPVPPLIA
ncbi:MAG: hypothetical protein ACYCZN_01735 [Candidatus Dormibacteria bacterium]